MKLSTLIILSATLSLLGILTIAYSDLLWSELWLGVLFFEAPLFLGFLTIFISSIVLLIKHKRIKNLLPLFINVSTILIIVFCPLGDWKNSFTFQWHFDEMNKIVQMVNSGELSPNVKHNQRLIRLPSQYENLSVGGGEIIVDKINDLNVVFFYTFRGTPDGRAGFIHLPKKTSLADLKRKIYYELYFQKKLTDNWFYISAD